MVPKQVTRIRGAAPRLSDDAPAPTVVTVGGPTPAAGATMVGAYEILGELGEGGMGKVYLGRHKLIGRKAAIKILNPDIASDDEVVSRFFNEARAVNDIRHPNIVEVTDFGQFGDLHCIVMELLEGETLAARLLRARTMDETTVVRIARQVTSALGAAHDRGLVHRDIKPENIFICSHPDYPDFVKVLDFGIAKLLGTESTPPFTADTLGRLIVCHVSEAPLPPVTLNPRVSAQMNRIVLRALQKKPKDRFASMKELRDAMEAAPGAPLPIPRSASAPVAARGPVVVRAAGAPAKRIAPPAPARPAPAPPPAHAPTIDDPAAKAPAVGNDMPSRMVALVMERLHTGAVELPALPPATVRCIELLRRSNLGFSEAARVIGDAASLRSRVMRLANSAAFPSLMPATTLEIAIARLGTDGLYQALIEFSAREVLAGKHPRVKEAFRRSWPHALGSGMIAGQLCQHFDRESDVSFAYLAALLHDGGKPIVGTLLLDIEQQMIRAGNRTLLTEAAWLAAIERCHRPAGAALARRWQLAHPVAEAIENSDGYDPTAGRSLANLVRFSTALAKRLGLVVGPTNAAEVDAICVEGRRLLKIDDGTERNVSHGLKERAIALSAIRGQ